jgi:excisionase family DNA binding protein
MPTGVEVPRTIAVSVRRAAEMLGVSKSTIRIYARSGRLPSARLGRRVLIPTRSLEKLFQEATQS